LSWRCYHLSFQASIVIAKWLQREQLRAKTDTKWRQGFHAFLLLLVNSWAQEGVSAFLQKQFEHLLHLTPLQEFQVLTELWIGVIWRQGILPIKIERRMLHLPDFLGSIWKDALRHTC
jgi:hypothetical protein